jgi:hypothetical protein
MFGLNAEVTVEFTFTAVPLSLPVYGVRFAALPLSLPAHILLFAAVTVLFTVH